MDENWFGFQDSMGELKGFSGKVVENNGKPPFFYGLKKQKIICRQDLQDKHGFIK